MYNENLFSGDLEVVKLLIETGHAQTETLIEELFEQEILLSLIHI